MKFANPVTTPLVAVLFLCGVPDCLAETPLNQLSPAESRSGWKLLFDGQTKDGWRNYQSKGVSDGWVVKDGILNRARKGAGDLVTENQYENFELAIEYRISEGGNSGVLFHVTEDSKKAWHSGPEMQLYDNANVKSSQKSGWLYELYKPVKPGWAM